jgi:tRNA threonylcarbamoyladenosine biosynthesis protein TsaB
MSAKALAYATGCGLVGVDGFAAIAYQTPPEVETLLVLADAQQDKAYVQLFNRMDGTLQPAMKLDIAHRDDWLPWLAATTHVAGPGLERFDAWIAPEVPRVPPELRLPHAESLLALGLQRLERGERDDPFALEPLYLRVSSAEEKWAALGRG